MVKCGLSEGCRLPPIVRLSERKRQRPCPFLKRGKHKNSLLQPQQGCSRKPFGNHQGTGRIFQNAALKNLHPFPLDDPHLFRCRILGDSHTQQDTKIYRYRLKILTKKTLNKKRHKNNLLYLLYLISYFLYSTITPDCGTVIN